MTESYRQNAKPAKKKEAVLVIHFSIPGVASFVKREPWSSSTDSELRRLNDRIRDCIRSGAAIVFRENRSFDELCLNPAHIYRVDFSVNEIKEEEEYYEEAR